MSKAVSKGQIIDSAFGKGELVESNGLVYACTLNQTDIDANKNKFYIMQLIKNGSNYTLGIRYGRTGEPGKAYTDAHASEADGIAAFQKQFKTKTGNAWGTKNFVKKANKYFMSEVSYEDELKNIPVTPATIPDSKLDKRVQDLIKMLSDVNMMQNALVNLEIDTKKLPLGKIKQSQLDKANDVLSKIQPLLVDITGKKGNVEELKQQLVSLSSDFYTLLPMAFGRRKPPVINTDEMAQKYHDVLDELRNMVIAVQMTENVKSGENPLDSIYNDINTTINPLDRNSQMWKEIEKYVANTHGPTHNYKLEIIDIYEIEQFGKRQKFEEHCKNIQNRTLLYHGSGMTNWISIMKNDLLLNPQKVNKNVIITGKMFSDGIYFASAITKSFGYVRSDASNGIGCLALAEVGLGKIGKRTQADYYITKSSLAKEKCDSIQGVGKYTPGSNVNINNLIIPNGKLVDSKVNGSLLYDEHIIYDSNQQFIRFLILVKNQLYK
ncbi:polyADP-ribose polymerase with WGR domain [Fadolivirus algeromassiliense]|jgi:poly [ADP-ribose] polymerase|uniref:Poly [ADP-ribose] polymerase 1 n=1 Tax=Fadolivirus FV1/VV64 TaxID=3070911 RepID=A0A7D3R0J4_9VIRU|nr:polyADP-ribose polymerase with WGR domain [Fadolivirus algeromassiliense]QKF93721.1 polyADP-ribose polymerase with WGR domain [Fadolivirus FV1/VV64]